MVVRSQGSSLNSGWCTRDSLCIGQNTFCFPWKQEVHQAAEPVSALFLVACEKVRLVLAFHEQLGFHYTVKQHSAELGTPVMSVSFIVVFRMVALPENFSQS